MFSGGLANTTMAVIETMKVLGNDVTFINTNTNVEWFDDVKGLKKEVTIVTIDKNSSYYENQFDLIIELVPFFESEKQRRVFSKHSIYMFRKGVLIPTIEYSLYPVILQKHNFDGISEIWCFELFSNSDEVKILETLTRKPVRLMPYLWTPSIIESHRNEHSMPLWLQVYDTIKNNVEWSPHICETNITSSSSCTIPMLIMRQAKLSKFPFSKYKVHNSDQIKNSDFFKDNIMKHCVTEDLSGEFVGRQRLTDFVFEPKSCIVSHARFIPFKPMLFDLAWCGIPFIHNSEVLNSITSFDRYYYPNNKISIGVEKLKQMDADLSDRKGWFSIENLQQVRKQILDKYTCVNSQNLIAYNNRIIEIQNSKIEIVPNIKIVETSEKKTFYLMFCDFWPDFNNSYNFFSLLLNSVPKDFNLVCCGENELPDGVTPNAIVYTMFGETHKKYPNVPKIYFTGENSSPVNEPSVKLNLGFGHSDMVSDTYLRFPLWILEIDWFNCDKERISNPKPIPLERCTNVYYDELKRKKKFCAFIVSNPTNPVRNKAFEWINEYKDVDSAGRLFNTVGNVLFAGPGGGGGELRKLEFLKDYKFCISYENSSSPGYVTEKLLHAKAAGCIPIYWGDPKVERDFNTNGFIDARNIHTKEELIAAVKAIDENNLEYIKKYSIPALDSYHVDWARRTMAELVNRIFKIVTSTTVEVPRFVGEPARAQSARAQSARAQPVEPVKVKPTQSNSAIETPLVVTYATREFLPSLNQWLTSFDAQRRMVPDLKALVYLGHDVPESTKEMLVKEFSFVQFDALPTETPEQFKDIWSGKHYAWKIYIYQKLANSHNGMVFYLDAGGFMCRWPSEYLRIAQEHDICVLEDSEQYNEQWCSDQCKNIMKISANELNQHQIVGGIMAFRAGSEKSKNYFNEAWNYAQNRDCIVGEKWEGVRNGKPYGHRHDQSILSVLSLRHKLAKYDLHTLYCDKSLRRTFLDNKFIYVHRGQFKIHEPFMEGVDDCFVINLKRRNDRLERLYTNSPELKGKLYEFEAYEGKKLQLTASLARLFKPHDFMWKKAIMGCALSHLELWFKLVTEKPEIQNYLILEDDVKFVNGWQQRWLEALPHLPENYDVIYLGGILPPNRAGFEMMKEKVNPYFSRVKENSMFGQNPPNRYFHFCAYAYVLSKQGAQKIMAITEAKDGYYTSADHMICNSVDFLNIYFLDPLVAGCYQDDDPVYANSEFNNFNRVDGFDSDLWNNDERFDKTEGEELGAKEALNIPKALFEARNSIKLDVSIKPSKTEVSQEITEVSKGKLEGVFKRICVLEEQNIEFSKLYEANWLYELFGRPKLIELQKLQFNMPPPVEKPICLVMKGHIETYKKLFAYYESNSIEYVVLHLSDEHNSDDISFYDAKCCVKVIRNYIRPNLSEKVLVIPLGYHYTLRNGIDTPLSHTPQLPFRSNVWCFFGTNWNNRAAILEPLKSVGKYSCKLFNEWNDPENLTREEYCATLLDSVFVPCIGGNNPETFRLYEALECGCIPLLVNDSPYFSYITKYIPLLNLTHWSQVNGLINQLYNDKQNLQTYRNIILQSYSVMKESFKKELSMV
jgi:alpha(1,3/1,4) fucosyltransferase